MGFSSPRTADKPRKKSSSKKSSIDLGLEEIEYLAQREAGVLNFDLIQVHLIKMDPDNPRTRYIDPGPLLKRMVKFLVVEPNHHLYDRKQIEAFDRSMEEGIDEVIAAAPVKEHDKLRGFFDRLIPMRDNIRLIGVKQPIELREIKGIKRNSYQIVYGHRRYLATVLAGIRSIPARIVAADANDKLVQTTENIMQESLSLAQRIDMFRQLVKSLGLDMNASPDMLSKLTGYSARSMRRFRTICRDASPMLLKAIDDGVVNSLRKAEELASKPEEVLDDYLSRPEKSPTGLTRRKEKPTAGRSKTTVRTPVFKSTAPIKWILSKLCEPSEIEGLDWSDYKAVEMFWIDYLKKIEKVSANETE